MRLCERMSCSAPLFLYPSHAPIPPLMLCSAYDVTIPAKGKAIVKTDLAVAIPSFCYGRVGTLHKHRPPINIQTAMLLCVVVPQCFAFRGGSHTQTQRGSQGETDTETVRQASTCRRAIESQSRDTTICVLVLLCCSSSLRPYCETLSRRWRYALP